jgi:hypothetical protein
MDVDSVDLVPFSLLCKLEDSVRNIVKPKRKENHQILPRRFQYLRIKKPFPKS